MTAALPTREDYFQTGAREVFARGAIRPQATRISPQAVFTEGTDINIILATAAAMADEATRHLAIRIAALYLDSAEDEDLDRLISDRFGSEVVRKQAAPAIAELVFSRSAPPSALAAVDFQAGHVFRTGDGTEFGLVSPMAFPGGSTGPVANVLVRAKRAGTGGNVAANTITELIGAGTPADTAITVTNPEPASGGGNVESNASLRERARDFYRSSRRGTLGAIEFGALTVPGVYSTTVEEVLGPNGLPNGIVRVWPADETGNTNQALAEKVRLALRNFRAAGIPVDVYSTQPDFQAIEYELAFRSGTDTRAAVAQLKAITAVVVNTLAPLEPLQRSLLFALARTVPGAIVTDQSVALPAGDIYPAENAVIKTRGGLIKVNGL